MTPPRQTQFLVIQIQAFVCLTSELQHSVKIKFTKFMKFCTKMFTLPKFSLPSHTEFEALKRFAIFSEYLYPQFITWDRATWEPRPTQRKKLIPWFLLSSLVAIIGSIYLAMLIRHMASDKKDADITITVQLLLILRSCSNSVATTIIFTFVLKVNEMCFMLRNLEKIKGMYDQGIDLYLHD